MTYYRIILLIGIVGFFNSQLKSQCANFKSPEPTCFRVSESGEVTVDFDLSSMGGAKPIDIERIDLWRSIDDATYKRVSNWTIGSIWPNPAQFIDKKADANNRILYYKIIAECSDSSFTALPSSEIIKTVKPNLTFFKDSLVKIIWNWDSLTNSSITKIFKRPKNGPAWVTCCSTIYKQNIDSIVDTLAYRIKTYDYVIRYVNPIYSCTTSSSISRVRIDPFVDIKDYTTNVKANIYPNPSSGYFEILFGRKMTGQLNIYNSEKSIVYSRPVHNLDHISIDLTSHLTAGIYIVHLTMENSFYSQKLIIQKK